MAKILIAEDTLFVAKMLKRKLELHCHEVDWVSDGQKALELWSDEYDILITDNDMPKKTGLQLAKAIREKEDPTPIIMISGDEIPPHDLEEHGITKFITKPFSLSYFMEEIEKYL